MDNIRKRSNVFRMRVFSNQRLSEAQREIVELLDEAGTKVTGMNTILSKLMGKKKSA